MSSASCASSRALPLASPLRVRRARRPTTTPEPLRAPAFPTSRTDPFKVVITGSTKGLGLELARGFLSRGDRVVVTSRDETRVREAVAALREWSAATASPARRRPHLEPGPHASTR